MEDENESNTYVLKYDNIEIERRTRIIRVDGTEIKLPNFEFEILYLLASHPGWVFTYQEIYETVWKECVAGCEHVVYNVICQLRRKLKNPDLIQTMVGRGYRFVGQKTSPGAVRNKTVPGGFAVFQ